MRADLGDAPAPYLGRYIPTQMPTHTLPQTRRPPDVDALARRIVERLAPTRVVLFGSRARGEDAPGDTDLFVEMETDRRPPERVADVLAVFGLRPWPLDVVVYTPAEVARLRRVPTSLLNEIEASGRVLYERA